MYNNPMSQKDPSMWYGIGQLYERLGSLEHAQESFEAVLRFEPNFNMALEVKFRLGIIAKQRGDYDGALERLKSVLHDVQTNMQTNEMASDIWTQIGHVYELKDEIQLAKSSYMKVGDLNPNNAKPLQQLGWLCLKHGEHANAIDYLKKAVSIDPNDGKGWYLLGRCYMAVHEFEEAYDAYKHAVTTDSQNPNVWCSLGVLFYQLNQHLDALDGVLPRHQHQSKHLRGLVQRRHAVRHVQPDERRAGRVPEGGRARCRRRSSSASASSCCGRARLGSRPSECQERTRRRVRRSRQRRRRCRRSPRARLRRLTTQRSRVRQAKAPPVQALQAPRRTPR
ncbi:hypothetical protein PINS_up021388 [Pythium insidiosum]|nr:hypothetical protein PINS_up021388 [Pythium insidiosum]